MNLTQIKQVLADGQIHLTKSLGQNFLHDANQIRRIIEAAEVSRPDNVLEIGPGLGALTQSLVAQAQEVLAIEKDKRLFDYLRSNFVNATNLSLIHADALDYLRRTRSDWTDWKLVSNLPYSVASPLLVELAQSIHPPKGMVVTVQLEVAQRISARPGHKEYGILSLLLQAKFESRIAFKIPTGCFFPAPDIDSACVVLQRRPNLGLEPGQYNTFAKIVKRGFSQRRKIMMKLLKSDWPLPLLEAAFLQLSIPPTARAETVTLDQFLEMTKLLTTETGKL
jgi:16S rRNA (adenine1518-N6/adenine1519-N6)-dimethyltransferase